ncbi:MAG: NAD(P)-binding protein [Eubacteriaceae bacterium]|nr:NAD(P)-binding protein [Eubacteriaceae bacterium]
MEIHEATSYTSKCFHGEPASCTSACPFHMDIRSFLDKTSNGKWSAAYKLLRNATVFPVIVSALCDQPCRDHCQRTQVGDEAIAIRDIEDACLRYVKNQKADSYFIPPKTQRVAVVGAGTAGLSCALHLGRKKFLVTVFEKENSWGGSIKEHPRFEEFDREISTQFSVVKVDFQYGREITSLDQLEDFDAVYVATGSRGSSFGLLERWNSTLFCSGKQKIFMGGGLCGVAKMQGIADGARVSRIIEAFLQTGIVSSEHNESGKYECMRYLEHEDAVSVPQIVPASHLGYSEEEAKQESDRCLQCDCDRCLTSCEMLKRFGKAPRKMAIEVYTDTRVNPPLSTHTLTRETYSCNQCGHCKSICPEQVDIGAMLRFSRAARFKDSAYPAALHDYWLREMDDSTTEGAFSSPPKGREGCDYAFFPGCQLGSSNPEHVFRSFEFLKVHYDAGIFISCCGAPAYWAGDEERMREHIDRLRNTWFELGEPTLVFACATCKNVFELFLPEIKGVSLYELLENVDFTISNSEFSEAVVFDPCASREDARMQASVRHLAQKAQMSLEELKDPNRCCGYGGLIRLANPELYEEVTKRRSEASDKPYIVYCANCREVFAHRKKECAHILDVVFGLGTNLEVPSLQKKRDNRLEVKKKLMKDLWGIDFMAEPKEWDVITLILEEALRETLDRKLITTEDLKESIWRAEKSGDKFFNEEDGMSLCSMERPVVTYWVKYKEIAPDTYEVFSAYTHRMRFVKEDR